MKPIWASEGPNMVPKWAEHLLKMAPWRLLGEPWAALGQPSGGPGARRPILERFWVPLGTPFGGSKMLKNVLENNLKFVVNSELSFGPSGGRGGPFWARIWGHLRFDFGPPGAICNFSEK